MYKLRFRDHPEQVHIIFDTMALAELHWVPVSVGCKHIHFGNPRVAFASRSLTK